MTNVDFAAARRHMVESQIAARGVRDPRVLDALRAVPRHRFVPPGLIGRAHADCALPIACGQTISQPFTVAFMCEAAELTPTDCVLEVGTGSGYAAAVLGRLCARVFSIETFQALAEDARARLAALGARNVDVRLGDGARGLAEESPFDAILVTARADDVPVALRDQLRLGGRLVLPVGPAGRERLERHRRTGAGFERTDLGGFSFVPLLSR